MFATDLYPLLKRLSLPLAARYETARCRRLIAPYLASVDASRLEAEAQRRALAAFRQAAASVPYYRTLLKEKDIRPDIISSIADFAKLPIISKQIFQHADIHNLALGANLDNASAILTSSGFSGIFSFGINLPRDHENAARMIDAVLDFCLGISSTKTLCINCLPMGVRIRTNTMVLAEVSVRDDMALAIVKTFARYFGIIIIIGEAFFVKHLIEEGARAGIDWKALPVSVVLGGDSFPESYRTYIARLLGIDLDRWPATRLIGSSLGIAEIGLNLFHETPDTIRIRRFADGHPDFRNALFGENGVTPMFFHYYPFRTYLEIIGGDIIVTTAFSDAKIPLIRYNTRDRGKIIKHDELCRILEKFGRGDLAPRLKLPLVAVWSRHAGDETQLADRIRDAIFKNPDIARRVTGYFKIESSSSNDGKNIRIQLSRGSTESDGTLVRDQLRVLGAHIIPIRYEDFDEALVLNYERKFRHAS